MKSAMKLLFVLIFLVLVLVILSLPGLLHSEESLFKVLIALALLLAFFIIIFLTRKSLGVTGQEWETMRAKEGETGHPLYSLDKNLLKAIKYSAVVLGVIIFGGGLILTFLPGEVMLALLVASAGFTLGVIGILALELYLTYKMGKLYIGAILTTIFLVSIASLFITSRDPVFSDSPIIMLLLIVSFASFVIIALHIFYLNSKYLKTWLY